MPFTGLSPLTVIIGLAGYALTILVRAMLEGFRSVPEEVLESARGLGYGPGRLLLRIELPLALPMIMAGLRIATVSTVALTTVGTLVSYGGLGNLIKDGVDTNFRAELFTAAVLCVVLAMLFDLILVIGQWLLTPWARVTSKAPVNIVADTWQYLTDWSNWTGDGGMLELLWQQLLITITALVIAMLIGLPLALWLGHRGMGGFLAMNISNVGRAIPDLRPVGAAGDRRLARDGAVRSRTAAPALATLIALTLFALPPIITNSYVAIREVPADLKEAAVGLGMTARQRFWRVELPLATPLIGSGLRLALVQVWATATIAALVAGPGLGRVITDGFYRSNYPKGIAGAIVVAVVALILELTSGWGLARVAPVREDASSKAVAKT